MLGRAVIQEEVEAFDLDPLETREIRTEVPTLQNGPPYRVEFEWTDARPGRMRADRTVDRADRHLAGGGYWNAVGVAVNCADAPDPFPLH